MDLSIKFRSLPESLARKVVLPVLLFALAYLLAGCSVGLSSPGGEAPVVRSTAPATLRPANAATLPTDMVAQDLVSTTTTSTPLAEVFLPHLEIEPSLTPTPPRPDAAPFQVCSPLAIHPVEELREIISDPYRPPPPGREERHHGVDFSYYRRGERTTIQGVGVQAILAGRVAASLKDTFPYGNLVIIETPREELPLELLALVGIGEDQSIYSLYAHMDQHPLVDLGETVAACQPLGEVGRSGNAAEPHLHLETRLGPPGRTFTSMAFYGAQDTPESRANYVAWRTGGEFLHFEPLNILYFDPTDPQLH